MPAYENWRSTGAEEAVSVRGPDPVGLKPADGRPAVSLSTNGTAGDLVTEPGCPPSDPETSFPVTDYQ